MYYDMNTTRNIYLDIVVPGYNPKCIGDTILPQMCIMIYALFNTVVSSLMLINVSRRLVFLNKYSITSN